MLGNRSVKEPWRVGCWETAVSRFATGGSAQGSLFPMPFFIDMNRAPRKNATGPKGVGHILPRKKLAPMAPRPPSRGGVLNPWRALAKASPPAVAVRAACRDPGKLYATEFHPATANPAELLQATRESPSHVGKDKTGATIVAPKRTLVTDRGKGAREGVAGSHGSVAYRNDRQQPKVGEPCAQMQTDSCGVRTHALAEWRLEPPP